MEKEDKRMASRLSSVSGRIKEKHKSLFKSTSDSSVKTSKGSAKVPKGFEKTSKGSAKVSKGFEKTSKGSAIIADASSVSIKISLLYPEESEAIDIDLNKL